MVQHTFIRNTLMAIATATLALTTACTDGTLDGAATGTDPQVGTLHIASIAPAESAGANTRATMDGISNTIGTGWQTNHVMTGFTAGDRLEMKYTFSNAGGVKDYIADLVLNADGTTWAMQDATLAEYAKYQHPTAPNQNGATGESWEQTYIYINAYPTDADGSWLTDNDTQKHKTYETDANDIRRYYDITSTYVTGVTNNNAASSATDVGNKTANGLYNSYFLDKDKYSETLSALTAQLYHKYTLLRIDAPAAVCISGYAEGYNQLKRLTAQLSSTSGTLDIAFDLITVTKNGVTTTYWQAIAPTGTGASDGGGNLLYYSLVSLTPTIGKESGNQDATWNIGTSTNEITLAPIPVSSSTTTDVKMLPNRRHNISLLLTPQQLAATTSAIPAIDGWDTTEEQEIVSESLRDTALANGVYQI